MENYSCSSYPDSGDSSPKAREIDYENSPWDEPPSNCKVKFMCSYGGKIQPRHHDNQLAYVGGHTKILTVDRTIKFSGFTAKIVSLCDAQVYFKYQLPGEDLDALISVTNDEDLDHMMLEYDRLHRASPKPARLRLFLFPVNPPAPTRISSNEPKHERWFADALNSVPIQTLDDSSSAAGVAGANPDFLFGLEKGPAQHPAVTPESAVSDVVPADIPTGSDSARDVRNVGGAAVEIQRQIQNLQRLQIPNPEQTIRRKADENLARVYLGDHHMQKVPEKAVATPSPVPVPAAYLQERHVTNGFYPATATATAATGSEQPFYLIPTSGAVYQAPPGTGQGYYAMPRVVQDIYREQPMYSMVPPGAPTSATQQPNMVAFREGFGNTRTVTGGAVGMPEGGYAQMAYDSAGRQVFYTNAPGGVSVMPSYQTAASTVADVRQAAVQEINRGVGKVSQASA